jgi:hypothetical protein
MLRQVGRVVKEVIRPAEESLLGKPSGISSFYNQTQYNFSNNNTKTNLTQLPENEDQKINPSSKQSTLTKKQKELDDIFDEFDERTHSYTDEEINTYIKVLSNISKFAENYIEIQPKMKESAEKLSILINSAKKEKNVTNIIDILKNTKSNALVAIYQKMKIGDLVVIENGNINFNTNINTIINDIDKQIRDLGISISSGIIRGLYTRLDIIKEKIKQLESKDWTTNKYDIDEYRKKTK